MSIRAAINRYLSACGKRNGHSCPQTGSNLDPILHHLMVSSVMKTRGKKEYELALENTIRDLEICEEDFVPGDDKTLVAGTAYSLQVKVSSPRKTIDAKILVAELLRRGVNSYIIDTAVNKATKTAKPSKTYTVTENAQ